MLFLANAPLFYVLPVIFLKHATAESSSVSHVTWLLGIASHCMPAGLSFVVSQHWLGLLLPLSHSIPIRHQPPEKDMCNIFKPLPGFARFYSTMSIMDRERGNEANDQGNKRDHQEEYMPVKKLTKVSF